MTMFEKQGQHYLLLIFLLFGVYFFARGEVLSGQLWGIGTQTWLWVVVATPVLHQIVVALLWRVELYHHRMKDWFRDKAFSVFHYFVIDRAYGEDHFQPSIYRNKPFVKQGMFRYTDNAMYKFGFLSLWVIALLFLSRAALLVAAFSHLYIWVHYYFTELPDIQYIYGVQAKESA